MIPIQMMKTIQITHGYSRDQRPDLKQAVDLLCSYRSIWFKALDGNRVIKQTFRTRSENTFLN